VLLIDTKHAEQTVVQLARTRAPAPRVLPSLDPSNRAQMEAAAADHGFAPDFSRKVLHYSWHPESDTVAIAGLNNLHIYNASRHAANPGGLSSRR